MAMNFEQARLNMVENQVRPWEVLDARVLDVLGSVHREDFVAAEHRKLAFADLALPLGHGEVMLKPVVEGRVLTSVDIHADFVAAAGERLAKAGITNVKLETGEAVAGWQPNGVFDAVVVTGAVYQIPQRFLSWLKPGGRLLVVRGESPAQHVLLLTHEGNGRYREESLFETDLPYLKHAEPPRRFVF